MTPCHGGVSQPFWRGALVARSTLGLTKCAAHELSLRRMDTHDFSCQNSRVFGGKIICVQRRSGAREKVSVVTIVFCLVCHEVSELIKQVQTPLPFWLKGPTLVQGGRFLNCPSPPRPFVFCVICRVVVKNGKGSVRRVACCCPRGLCQQSLSGALLCPRSTCLKNLF